MKMLSKTNTLRISFVHCSPMRRILALLLCSCAAACGSGDNIPRTAPDRDLRCIRGDLERRLLMTGVLEAVEAVDITVPRTPQWSVQIKWMVPDGAEVKSGDKILEFDNASFTDTLEENRSSIQQAQRTLEQHRAQAEVARLTADIELEKARIKLKKAELDAGIPRSVLSEQEYQGFQLELERAKVAFAKAEENQAVAQQTAATDAKVQQERLAKIRRDVETAERAISDLVITAPLDGIVVAEENPREGRKFKIGDSPWVGLSVLRIPDFSRMQVRALLMDVDDGLLETWAAVICSPDAHPDLLVKGRVVDITPVAQEPQVFSLRRAFGVLIELDESDPTRMQPGMSVKVEAAVEGATNVLLAPRAALNLALDPPRARLASGSWREVRIGVCSPQKCVIKEGLDEGDRLSPAGGWSE